MTQKYSRTIKNIIATVNECITKNWHLLPFSEDIQRSDFEITAATLANQKTIITLFYQIELKPNIKINEHSFLKSLHNIDLKIESALFMLMHTRGKLKIIFKSDNFLKDLNELDKVMQKI